MEKLKSQLESLLFISAKPMSLKQLADLTQAAEKEVDQACAELAEEYQQATRGLQVIKNGSKYQMVSSAANAAVVQAFIQDETKGELSRPSLETLTIIAYRGPICKMDLDRLRGINCSLILRNLLLRGLIEATAEEDDTYYQVSFDFLKYLGLADVKELPDYEQLHNSEAIDRLLNKGEMIAEAVEDGAAPLVQSEA